MKTFIVFVSLISIYLQDNIIFNATIDGNYTKIDIEKLVSDAKKRGIVVNIPYISYTSRGTVKVAQIVVESDGFTGSTTADFSKTGKCVEILRDFNKNAKVAFYIGDCAKSNDETGNILGH